MALPIYLDLQAAQNPSHAGRGIARYSVDLTLSMLRADLPVAAVALNPYLPLPELPDALASSPLLVRRSAAGLARVAAGGPFAYQLTSPMELELPPTRTIPTSALERADALVAVLYDLIPLLFPERYLVSPRSRERYHARLALLRDADLLLAISEHTRLDAIEHLGVSPERVAVVGGAASGFFRTPEAGEDPRELLAREHPQIRPPFVLTVAAWEWRKNLETLIHAMARLPASVRGRVQFVVVCSGLPEGERSWQRAATAAGLDADSFVVVGPVTDAVLRALYQSASLFVFPSRYEGFGLPVIEAARCGAPVLTSSTSSLPEILDLPSSTFSPEDVDAIAQIIERGLTDDAFRASLLEAGARASSRHTWEAVGRRVTDAYQRLGEQRAANASLLPGPVRVAFVGAHASASGARALLADRYRVSVDVFDPSSRRIHRPFIVPDDPVYPIEAFDKHLDPYDYDVFVYAADDINDRRVERLAREHPGIVWLGDEGDHGRGEATGDLAEVVLAMTRQASAIGPPLS